MVRLEKGQFLKNETDLVVFTTGEYDENTLVEVAYPDAKIAHCAYPAFYIATGEIKND